VTVRAIVADPTVPLTMRVDNAPEPAPFPHQALIGVEYVSLNHGDLNDSKSGRVPAGDVLGSDAAGVVIAPAADGSGPVGGTRVVALAQGAFAEIVAVDSASLAEVPPSVDLAVAAALPVAGVAALRALRDCGSLLGKRVLITGASGGVGTFAVQLAAAAGAHVIASVGSAARGDDLESLGAHEVVIGLDDVDEPVDTVIDTVGGPQLARAWGLLAAGGIVQSVGWTSGQPAVLAPYATVGPPKTLRSYLTQGDVGADLAALVRLVEAGDLAVTIGWRGQLADFADAVEGLRDRKIRGKAVLDVRP
jgi:NADPH2:quinone reductase